jgi:hypothetical protein
MASAGIVCSVDLKEVCTGQAVCRYPYIKNFSMTAKILQSRFLASNFIFL